jgi:hypothetical protein
MLMTDARFTRTISDQGSEFTVWHTRQSALLMAVAVVLFGSMGASGIIGGVSGGGGGVLMAGVACLGVLWLGFFLRRKRSVPLTLRIGRDGLHTPKGTFAMDDIAELQLAGKGQYQASSGGSFAIGGTGASGLALAAGVGAASAVNNAGQKALAAYGNALNNAENELRVRRRSNSKPITIIKHLSREAGEALLTDLLRDLQQFSAAEQVSLR